MKNVFFFAFLIVFFSACKRNEPAAAKQSKIKVITKAESKVINRDSLYRLLNSTIDIDSIETENGDPFLNLKTGYFLSDKYKSAVLIMPQKDSLFKIEIYTEEFNRWVKNDELKNLNINPIQFKWIFKDYNFDGQKDIYIQEAVSNGLAISYGCLVTINPRTKKFFLHSETIDLGSIEPDNIKKTITSIEMSECMQPSEPCILTHKWHNNKLVTIGKKCPDCDYSSDN